MTIGKDQWDNWTVEDHIDHIGDGIGRRHEQEHILVIQTKNARLQAAASRELASTVSASTGELSNTIDTAASKIAEAGRAQEMYARNLAWATWALVAATAVMAYAALTG